MKRALTAKDKDAVAGSAARGGGARPHSLTRLSTWLLLLMGLREKGSPGVWAAMPG